MIYVDIKVGGIKQNKFSGDIKYNNELVGISMFRTCFEILTVKGILRAHIYRVYPILY